jgi:hypothetical protein
MKPILRIAALKAQQSSKLVLLKVLLWRTFNKTNFDNENCYLVFAKYWSLEKIEAKNG